MVSIAADLERWKAFLLTCPDGMFFDIMRTTLGNVQTPFNKHSLTKRLLAYLGRKETKERVLTLISDQDAFLLTVVFVLNEPDLAVLYSFVKDTYEYLELHTHLLNLEERMLIYRIDSSEQVRVFFNPVLFDTLLKNVIDTRTVFVSREVSIPTSRPPWFNDLLIVSIIAYLRENPSPLKASGKPKKRTESDLIKRFSSLGPEKAVLERISLVINGLKSIGILADQDGGLSTRIDELPPFAALKPNERLAHIVGGLWRGQGGINTSLSECAASAIFLLENLEKGRAYQVDSVRRLLIAGGCVAGSEEGTAVLLDVMTRMALLFRDSGAVSPVPQGDGFHGAVDESVAVVQPNYEVTLKPSALFTDSLELALMAEIRTFDFCSVFELTRNSVTRRFADGVLSRPILDALQKLNGGPASPNVIFSIDSWEKEYRSVKLFYGAVLLIEPGRQHLVEHCSTMSALIVSMPAPGVYLLSTSDTVVIEKALRDCGIDQAPALEARMAVPPDTSRPQPRAICNPSIATNMPAANSERKDGRRLVRELTEKLESMNVDQDAKNELMKLIDKRLILYADQLDYYAAATREKSEARGFDYVGKIRIIEQTLAREDLLLEIISRGSGGKSIKHLVKPLELRKSGTDLDLYCKVLPDQTDLKLRVRSLSLVRAIRGSLFVVN